MRMLRISGVLVVLLAVAVAGVLSAPAARGQIIVDRVGPGGVVRLNQDRALMVDWLEYGSQIGASVRDVDSGDIAREKLDASTGGAVVEEVDSDGPAAKAGLKTGDVIVEYDGEKVRSARHLVRLVRESRDDRAVKVVVMRAAKRTEVTLTPASGRRTFRFEGPALRESLRGMRDFGRDFGRDLGRDFSWEFDTLPFGTRARLGVGIQDVTGQLAEYFGVKDGGVLVTSVTAESPASKAGLKAGDVITAVNGRSVRRGSELIRELRDVDDGKEVSIDVTRERKSMTVKATLESRTPARRIRMSRRA